MAFPVNRLDTVRMLLVANQLRIDDRDGATEAHQDEGEWHADGVPKDPFGNNLIISPFELA